MSLLKEISQRGQVQKDLKDSDATDAGTYDVIDRAASSNDVKFMAMRNNINTSGNVTGVDVANYLNRAAELNDEVDTVPFGLETDDGDIVKVYVRADQADEFETAMKNLLGLEDDIEEAIKRLSSEFDVIDVVWPDDDDGSEDEFSDLDLDDPLDRNLPDDEDTQSTDPVEEPDSSADDTDSKADQTVIVVPDEKSKDADEMGDIEKAAAEDEATAEDSEPGDDVDDVDLSDEEKEKRAAKKKAKKTQTTEGNQMSQFLKQLLNEAATEVEDNDAVKDGLSIPLDGQQKALMSKMKRQLEKKIVNLFVISGIPGRYLNSSEVDDGIKDAADMLRKQVTIRRHFDRLYLGLGHAKGFGIAAPVKVEEAAKRRGSLVQKMLEAILVKLGLPENLVLTSGPAAVGSFLLKTAKIIEQDTELEQTLRQMAIRMGIKTGELFSTVDLDESIEVGPDEFSNAVVQLIADLGIPDVVLQQKRAIVIKSIREKKMSMRNRSEVLRKIGILQVALNKSQKNTEDDDVM